MKLASISVVKVTLLACVVAAGAFALGIAGCSSGSRPHSADAGPHAMDTGPARDTGTPVVDTGTGGPHDTGPSPHDSGTPVRDTGGGGPRDTGSSSTCTATCTSDSVCASMCGPVPGGGNRCCDRSTSHCFVSHSACPTGGGGDGGGMSY